MGKFTEVNKHLTELKEITIPKGDTKRLHLVDVKARVSSDIAFKFNKKLLSVKIGARPFNGPKGIWSVDLKALGVGKVELSAIFKTKAVASTKVSLITKPVVKLATKDTDEGLLTRLFLAESVTPGQVGKYKADESKKSMLWMRQVIENRLNHKTPRIFGAKLAAGSSKYVLTDIIKAQGQFHGFENYPTIDKKIDSNITLYIAYATNYNHPKREQYLEFINNAKAAAAKNALSGFKDPLPKGLYGWRTKGSTSPGGDFVKYKDFAGQTFYTLK